MKFWAIDVFSDRALLLALALLLDVFLGDPRVIFRIIPHPISLLGNVISFCERNLNHKRLGEVARLARGASLTVGIAIIVIITGWLLQIFMAQYGLWALELILIAFLVAQRSLYDHVRAVVIALERDGIEAGRRTVSHIVGRNTENLDGGGVSRAAIESLAENLADGVVAPALWYLIFGLPGLFFCKAINTMDSMIGYRNERYNMFGRVAARLDDAVMWIPARFAAGLIILAACLFSRSNPLRAIRFVLNDASKHPSVNAGWPEAAMAGALNYALGGPRQYKGGLKEGVWIGNGRFELLPVDIRHSLNLFVAACCLNNLLILSLWLALSWGRSA